MSRAFLGHPRMGSDLAFNSDEQQKNGPRETRGVKLHPQASQMR